MLFPVLGDLLPGLVLLLVEELLKDPGQGAGRSARPQGLAGQVIFSCLTFLSMTWREASSSRTSSKLMPSWSMRTITW